MLKVERYPNRLIKEKSPYLLQHAFNPVDWYPWSQEAFDLAIKENRPVFLSIGYSTCHWCHVMEKESFENIEIARLMNETFISMKVDREERPDIDNLFMSVCQIMTGGGGWPLTIVMTPQKKPFFAGTYFPPKNSFGRIGMLELIPKIQNLWETGQDDIVRVSGEIIANLQRRDENLSSGNIDISVLEKAFEQLKVDFDEQYGGFGSSPKFPTPHRILFLLRYWKRTEDEKAKEMAEKTLDSMRKGGIYDHLGSGFHRYSTDSQWLVPHFEKMLYDQAMLAMAYTEAYQALKKEEYKITAMEIFEYVLRDMTYTEGGFYSAEDADSEGEEGKFYVWTVDEVEEILGVEDAGLICRIFNLKKEGNFIEQTEEKKMGSNILHLTASLKASAMELGLSEEALLMRLKAAKKSLFAARQKREHPFKDDKILADWNGLMITALARGAAVFQNQQYAEAASKAVDFILTRMLAADGRLFHRYRDGESALPAHVDDYAFLISGLIGLYDVTLDRSYLTAAISLNGTLLKHYWDMEQGGLFFTADDGEDLLIRKKEIYDGAIPSGNSVAMMNMLKLSRITGDQSLKGRAIAISKAFSYAVHEAPYSYAHFLSGIDLIYS